ncbi:HEPN domain-containing protein [Vibrio splendidus]|uniref:Uncharacterized protein n=1 Tax=Vibrio splendidus TaxID=29497 RepID=A0A2T5E8H1_VIBSP|nr:HEPN domain-containing protein [Vibrio splendidus]OEE57653.1 hypothetical protein A147_22750 [Vibrio splendidus FF-6]PTP15647.1 hypothetical protein CWO36_19765 [Vibrio splendidus]
MLNLENLETKILRVVRQLPELLVNQVNNTDEVARLFLDVNSEQVKEIADYLSNNQDVVSDFDNKMFNYGSGASLVTLELLSRWLIGITRLNGVAYAINSLQVFISSPTTPCMGVAALSGISVNDEIRLTDELTIVPFNTLPLSRAKETFFPPFMEPVFALKLGFSPIVDIGYKPPESAVVLSFDVAPKTSTKSTFSNNNNLASLTELGEFLTLIDTATPVVIGMWSELKGSVPCKEIIGGGWSSPVVDVLSKRTYRLTQDKWDEHSALYAKFVALPQKVRDLLRVPIERINQARRRTNQVDRAIELGVACEALLLNDKEHNAQLSFILKLRAALFLGRTYEEKQTLMHFFGALYSCRSNAAHTGRLKPQIKIAHRGNVDVHTVLAEGDALCVEMIVKIIEQGGFPNWDELVLQK